MIKFLNCLSLSSAVHSVKKENSIQVLSKYYYNTLEVKLIISFIISKCIFDICITYDNIIFDF